MTLGIRERENNPYYTLLNTMNHHRWHLGIWDGILGLNKMMRHDCLWVQKITNWCLEKLTLCASWQSLEGSSNSTAGFRCTDLWRGMKNVTSSEYFMEHGGAEGACMSTSTSLKVVFSFDIFYFLFLCCFLCVSYSWTCMSTLTSLKVVFPCTFYVLLFCVYVMSSLMVHCFYYV